MKKMMMNLLILAILVVLNTNLSSAKIVGGAEGEITIILQYKGLKWPICDTPKDNCTIRFKVVVGKLTEDPQTGLEYFDMCFESGDYDIDSDGNFDIRQDLSDVGSSINLGEFVLPANLSHGEGDTIVEVNNEPIDPITGIFRAYKK